MSCLISSKILSYFLFLYAFLICSALFTTSANFLGKKLSSFSFTSLDTIGTLPDVDTPITKLPLITIAGNKKVQKSGLFTELQSLLEMDEESLLEKLKEFKEKGVLRRISAILYHRRVGYTANAMVVWRVLKERLEEVGTHLASFRSVSHCYERTTNGVWEYNLFSMVHGKQKEEVETFIEKVSKDLGIMDYRIIYSVREFKKRRIKYFSEEFYEWYRSLL